MDVAISVEGLRKRYGQAVAVEDVSFEVHRGEIFGLLGPNGAGKTTTVECLQGLREADGGTVDVLGFDPATEVHLLRRHIGSQLQESAIPERIRVGEALQLFASVTDRGPDWRELLAQWGLADKEKASFSDLSGGQRQRLFVALALVNEPDLVFLDEMTTGLDPAARRVAWDLIEAIRGRGTTVVLVTHFMDEAERLCDRLAVVDRGRIVASGSPRELILRHVGATRVRFTADGQDVSYLADVEGVLQVRRDGPQVTVEGEGAVAARVGHALVERGLEPVDFETRRASLEDVFLALTSAGEEV